MLESSDANATQTQAPQDAGEAATQSEEHSKLAGSTSTVKEAAEPTVVRKLELEKAIQDMAAKALQT